MVQDLGGVRRVATSELTSSDVAAIRALMDVAFGQDEDERFTDDDWEHALGGLHFVLDLSGAIVAHAAVVEREIHVNGRLLRTGYVEAVATAPDQQGLGYGTQVMTAATAYVRDRFELGMLGTGRQSFYARLGWTTWTGPSFVRMQEGPRPTPDDDGHLMVLSTPTTPPLDPAGPISCEWRPGDVW